MRLLLLDGFLERWGMVEEEVGVGKEDARKYKEQRRKRDLRGLYILAQTVPRY